MSDGEWAAVGPASDIAVGAMAGRRAGSQNVAIYNVDGTLYATNNVCTHAFAFLSDGWFEGKVVECPLHAGQFDVTTGKGMGPPIMCDIATYPVRIVDGTVEVHVPVKKD